MARIRPFTRGSVFVPFTSDAGDLNRISKHKAKIQALAEQDGTARLARAREMITDAVCTRALKFISDAGGTVAYTSVHAKIKNATRALELCYERGHTASAGRGQCSITPKGREWLRPRIKTANG